MKGTWPTDGVHALLRPPAAAARGSDPLERTRTERFFDPAANLVEVDADDAKCLRILLIERHGVSFPKDPHDLRSDIVETNAEPVERLMPDARAVTEQSKQQVLGTDVVVMQAERFLLSEDHRSPGAVREVLEHAHYLP